MHPVVEIIHRLDDGADAFELAVRYPASSDEADDALRLVLGRRRLRPFTSIAVEAGPNATLDTAWRWYHEQFAVRPIGLLDERIARISTR